MAAPILRDETVSSGTLDPKTLNKTILFISYISENREEATKLCNDLEDTDLNLKPWIDTTGILAGQNWEFAIKKAIKECRYFIPLFSQKALRKPKWTKKEFQYVLKTIKEAKEIQKQKIIVIPVRLDECEIPYSELEKIQRVDLFPDWKGGIEKILQAIKLGDNLVQGHQFERNSKLGRIKTLQTKIPGFKRNTVSGKPSPSSAMLLLLDSTMVIDKNSVINPCYDHHTPYRTSGFGSKGSSDGQFDNPTGIAIDGSNYVYVADKDNHRIQKFDSSGKFIAKWGFKSRLRSSGSSDGQFDNPTGIAIDGSNYVYVTDKDNHRIQKFDSSGKFIAKWGSKGSSDGQFDKPESLCISKLNGCIFVVDPNNHRIKSFSIHETDEFVRKGTYLFCSHKYQSALECFEKATEIDENYAYAWVNKGVSFYQLGKYQSALECFEKATEIDENYAYAWVNKGVSFYQLGKYQSALECFEKATEIDENYAYAWVNKGKSLIHKEQYQDALKSFEKSININRNDGEAWINKGLTYYLLNEYDSAIKCFDKNLLIIPRNEGAYYYRGCSKVKNGQEESGLQDLSKAVKVNRNLISSLNEESISEIIIERLQDSIANTVN